jgi:hypothetical protein
MFRARISLTLGLLRSGCYPDIVTTYADSASAMSDKETISCEISQRINRVRRGR